VHEKKGDETNCESDVMEEDLRYKDKDNANYPPDGIE